jgi:hypothetical protein
MKTGNTSSHHVDGGMTPEATVIIEAFHFRMFSYTVIACNFISMAFLVLRYLPGSWCQI